MTLGEVVDYRRLADLSTKADRKIASKSEKDELMEMLHRLGRINDKMYNDYKGGRQSEDVIEAAITIGAIILLGYMLTEAFKR